MNRRQQKAADRLKSFALSLPEAWEDHPWGDTVVKVGKKVFVFLGSHDRVSLSTKLPESRDEAMTMPFTRPTGYGLGRGGWVTSAFDAGQDPPVDILCDWIEESYRAVAPKKLVAELDRRGEVAPG